MIIEPASKEDISDISELNRVFRKAPDIPIKFDNPEWIGEHITYFHVIRDSQSVVAHCCLTIHEDFAKLDILVVRKDIQGRGLGQKLIQHAILLAKQASVSELRVGSAKRFNKRGYYLRQGFELDLECTHDGSDEFRLGLS